MGIEEFLSHEPPAPEVAAPDEVLDEPVLEAEAPAEPSEDTPPSGLDKRDQAIWREERNKRKELQSQVDQMNARWQDMMMRMQAPAQQQPAPAQQPMVEIPNFDEDPIGHLKARNDILERQLHQAQTVQMAQVVQAQQAQQFNGLRSTVDNMETQFAAEHPDYHEAVGHLYAQVERMAEAMGYPPNMKQKIVAQTAMDISIRALQQGQSPAELAYTAAKQMGWGSDAGLPSPDVAPAPKPPKAAPTSLGAVAGKADGGNPTWDAISKMDDAEFDTWWKKFERQQRGR